jgi:hypothetical protein
VLPEFFMHVHYPAPGEAQGAAARARKAAQHRPHVPSMLAAKIPSSRQSKEEEEDESAEASASSRRSSAEPASVWELLTQNQVRGAVSGGRCDLALSSSDPMHTLLQKERVVRAISDAVQDFKRKTKLTAQTIVSSYS